MLDAAPMPTDSYVIKSGDTMGKIAANNPFTLTQLITSNPQIEDPNKIEVGQYLNFPPVGEAKAGQLPTSTGTTNSMLEINDPQGEGDRPAISMSSFVSDYLKGHEGTKSHKSLEGGKDTQAYGVKFSLGLNKKAGESDANFAARVAEKHYGKVVEKFNTEGKVFRSLPQKAQAAILDLHFNVGNIGDDTAKASTVEGMLKNTLNFNVFTSKSEGKKVLASLVSRRAKNWNEAADDLGVEKIAKVTVENIYRKENGKNVFDKAKTLYLDSAGNTIKEVINTKYPAVTVNKKGKTTELATTKEYTF
jgi:GH24 family phage-related lysozyme (muramidase)